MPEWLGPLELVGDRWVIGDSKRAGGSFLVLAVEGMEHHESGAPEPRAVVPWHRFVELNVTAAQWAWMATPAMGVLGAGSAMNVLGRRACSVQAVVRHPYEDWSANYTHHKRPYEYFRIALVSELFRKTVEVKAAHRLGDPEWLGAAVARLALVRDRSRGSVARSVRETIDDLGT
ncbi:hypothetical protein ACIBK8_22220 [Streptomyces sp. NPDC050161]|uniref:hypothetical protein n=1 Tax=Streptomyces sp. NPDC050161 TaxID=3365604 RepID=UPI00378BDB1A